VIVTVARNKSVSRIDRIVDSRTERSESPGHKQTLANLDNVESGIQDGGSEQIVIVGIVAVRLEKERSLSCL